MSYRPSTRRPARRSPHGERGLKSCDPLEIVTDSGRSPHGERGLKCLVVVGGHPDIGRSPHGERGLKFAEFVDVGLGGLSLSSWRAWIEIAH